MTPLGVSAPDMRPDDQSESNGPGDEAARIAGMRIKNARVKKRMSQERLGTEVGTNQQTIGKIEKGTISRSSFLPAIAKVLDLTLSEVGVRQPTQGEIRFLDEPVVPTGPADFPVYAAAQGGRRGEVSLTSDPVQWEPRPGNLVRVKDSYGVIIVGESMTPEYEPGDIAFINPHLPPIRDVTCLFRREEHGEHLALVKRLMRITADSWHVHQWNPARGESHDLVLPRRDWRICHRVVGKYSRR